MSDVTLSSAVRSNLLSLQNTADLMATTQERLATGNKVNSALDNPTNFFTASSLNSRAGDLGRLLDSVANATQTLEAADNGISAITKLVESAQASARQAQQVKGQQTTSVVTGATSATFNPQQLTSVFGDNDATGTNSGVVGADAAAAINSGSIAGDIANIADLTPGDISGATSSAVTLDAAGGPNLADGDSLTLNVNGVNYTLNITDDGATGAARAGDATNGYTITLDQDETVGDLDDALNVLLAGSGASVAEAGGALTYSFSADVDTVVFSASGGNSADLAAFNLNAVGADYTSSTGDTGDRIIARNADFQGLLDSNDGQTLQVQVGNGTTTTLTLGTGAGEISTKEDLLTALNNVDGLTATGNATAAGAIALSVTDPNDADSAISLTASAAEINGLFSFDVAADDGGLDLDTADGLITTATGANLLTQNVVTAGETIDIQVGNAPPLTVTFGNGTGQVSTLGELNNRLQDLAGGAASVDARGEINVTADNAGDSVRVGGDANALSSFGLTTGETSSLLDGTNIQAGDQLNIQVGTNTQLTITFGTGTGQVNTLSELEDALGNLAGGRATIDDDTGAITVEATQGTDSITVSSDRGGSAQATIGASFGLTDATTAPTTTDSTRRAELRDQYNELLIQIDELAEDAGFNGINLLNGDDLKVIFNEDGSSELDIEGVNFDASSLGISRASTGFFQTDANIETTLTTLDSAIQTLRSQASKFGSNLSVVETRENFTKSMINTLETGAANLTLADTNEEGANLLALQTRQQLSSTALSLASQADQNVLRLF